MNTFKKYQNFELCKKLARNNWDKKLSISVDKWGFEMPAFNGRSITKNMWHLEIEPKLHDKGKRLKQQRLPSAMLLIIPDVSKKIRPDGFNGKMTAYGSKNWEWINFKYLRRFSLSKQGLKTFSFSSDWIVLVVNYVSTQCKAYDANRKSQDHRLRHSIFKSRNGISAVGHLG